MYPQLVSPSSGSTSVHFLPENYIPQKGTGMLYAMELFQRSLINKTRVHGLLVLEDDVVFAPEFDKRLYAAVNKSDALARNASNFTEPMPFLLLPYFTSEKITLEAHQGHFNATEENQNFTHIAQKFVSILASQDSNVRRVASIETWNNITVRWVGQLQFKYYLLTVINCVPTTKQVKPRKEREFVGSLGLYMSNSYVSRALAWCRENLSMPHLRGDSTSESDNMGIGSDFLLTAFQKADLGVMPMILSNHLVQHVGINASWTSVQQLTTFNFARTVHFPYVEGYIALDEDEWW